MIIEKKTANVIKITQFYYGYKQKLRHTIEKYNKSYTVPVCMKILYFRNNIDYTQVGIMVV